MSNKTWGLSKEREVKKRIYDMGAIFVQRSRGSFGLYDVIAFFEGYCLLISVKATKQKKFGVNSELKKLKEVKLPGYCKGELWVYYSPNSDRPNDSGWKRFQV